MELAQAFHLRGIVVMDEFSDKQTQFPDETLFSLFEKSILRANLKTLRSPTIRDLRSS